MTTFAEIERIIARYDAATIRLDEAVTARIADSLDAAYRNLERELRQLYPQWQSDGSLFAVQRRLLLMEELGSVLEVIRPEQQAEYEALFTEALQISHESGGRLADELIKARAPGYPLEEFTTIPIEAAVAQARDGVARLYRYNDEFKTAVSGVVEQGLIQGWGADKVARMLRGNEQMQGRFGVAQLKSKAETIARTEVMSAFHAASQERYERAGIEWVQVFLTPSENSCSYCVARNGNVYEAGKISVPFHPRCRCVISPIKRRWQERGWTQDEAVATAATEARAAFEAEGGKINTGPTYWERRTGLEKAPEPVWKPGQQRPSPPPRPGSAQTTAPTPPTPRPRPPAAASALPESHTITANPRIAADSLDKSLDAIATPGAAERVGLVREFVTHHNIQAVFHDAAKPARTHLNLIKKELGYQGWANGNARRLGKYTRPLKGALGYTAPWMDHVVVNTDSRLPGAEVFGVMPSRLNSAASNAIARAREGKHKWTVGSVVHYDSERFFVWLHELGHQVHFKGGTKNPPTGIAGSVTQYGATNNKEWFAEHFSLWLVDAPAYAEYDPVGAKFIEDTMRAAIAAPRRQ